MELKHIAFNNEIVLAIDLNLVKLFFFFQIVKIEFKNEDYRLFFQEDVAIAPKQDCPTNFLNSFF